MRRWPNDNKTLRRSLDDSETGNPEGVPWSLYHRPGESSRSTSPMWTHSREQGSYAIASREYEEFLEMKDGSTRIALETDDRPFDRFLFIDVDSEATESLRDMARDYPDRNIEIVTGDANIEIPGFCRQMKWNDQAVVFLDPYATSVIWSTIQEIAATKKIDCWVLFPRMAVARMMPNNREPDEANARRLRPHLRGSGVLWQGELQGCHPRVLLRPVPRQGAHAWKRADSQQVP